LVTPACSCWCAEILQVRRMMRTAPWWCRKWLRGAYCFKGCFTLPGLISSRRWIILPWPLMSHVPYTVGLSMSVPPITCWSADLLKQSSARKFSTKTKGQHWKVHWSRSTRSGKTKPAICNAVQSWLCAQQDTLAFLLEEMVWKLKLNPSCRNARAHWCLGVSRSGAFSNGSISWTIWLLYRIASPRLAWRAIGWIDATSQIGTGRFMRCPTLADVLKTTWCADSFCQPLSTCVFARHGVELVFNFAGLWKILYCWIIVVKIKTYIRRSRHGMFRHCCTRTYFPSWFQKPCA